QLLHPRRRRRRNVRGQRRRVDDRLPVRIERRFHLRVVCKHPAMRRERASLAPPVAVVEDADDEAILHVHRCPPAGAGDEQWLYLTSGTTRVPINPALFIQTLLGSGSGLPCVGRTFPARARGGRWSALRARWRTADSGKRRP